MRCLTGMLTLSMLHGCTIAVRDCDYFADCVLYEPQGLNCGFAHQSLSHRGASCALDYDPAARRATESLAIATATASTVPCPEGTRLAIIRDRGNVPEQAWSTCVSLGNRDQSGGDNHDQPAGAVCGLSRTIDGQTTPCGEGGALPSAGECPEGWTFRWVPDRFADNLNEDCTTVIDADGPVMDGAIYNAIPLTFCQLDEGAGFEASEIDLNTLEGRLRVAGRLCGLHARGQATLLGDDATEPVDPAVQEQSYQAILEQVLGCADQDTPPSYLADIADKIESGFREPPQCLGHFVTPDDPCPAGLELVCAPGHISEGDNPVTHLCWCDVAESKQSL